MKKSVIQDFVYFTTALMVLFCACVMPGQAQSVPDAPSASKTFNLQAQAVALPGNKETLAASDVGALFNITQNLSLRSDNVLASGFEGYFGGVQYALPILSTKLNNISPNLDGLKFQAYLTASAGIDYVADRQHYAFLAGGGVNFDPDGSGKFAVNLFDVRYAKLPGFANSTAIVSSGLKLGF